MLLGFARLARSTFFSRLQVKPDKDKRLKAAIKRIKARHPDYGYRRVHACLPGVNHKKIQRLMRELGLQVRSRKGNCLDNAAMESFFGRLKTECFYGKEFKTKEEIVEAVRDYLDYYNHRRIQLKLKGLSPIQYRCQSLN